MAEANLTKSANIDITARSIDFVTSFARQWDSFREIMGITRQIEKEPGTKLTMKRVTVDLQNGAVGEGETVPLSQANVEEVSYGTVAVKKHKKEVTIEAINDKGYDAAVQSTDEELRNEVFDGIITDLYTSMQNYSTLRSTEGTFQMALAMALGRAKDRWKKMRKSAQAYVGWCNTLDLYQFYGAQPITVQVREGIEYVKDFMGYSTLVVSSEIPRGTVIATAVNNLISYNLNPSHTDYARSGLEYITDGESNLIGFHARGNYDEVGSVSDVIYGIYLYCEYPDGIALVTIDAAAKNANLSALTIGNIKLSPKFDPNVIAYTATTTSASNTITATAEDTGATVGIKVNGDDVTSGSSATWTAGTNNVVITVTNDNTTKTYTVTVTK